MPSLALYLLGSPRIERDGVAVLVDTRKATALLAYLVVTGQPQGRDTLAALLWPEYDQAHARAALRRALSALNRAIGTGPSGSPGGVRDLLRSRLHAASEVGWQIWHAAAVIGRSFPFDLPRLASGRSEEEIV